ncbi:MAG TPA: uridine kinase [Epulopiscium sp.]|nr:uridine kinase [Candidatus Epulonipiscium sp.]
MEDEDVVVIGIAGGTGSGKTTLVEHLEKTFMDKVIVIPHDHYYKSNGHLSLEERRGLNYDHPSSFDTDMMVGHIKMLKNGEAIERPEYSFVEHTRMAETVHIKPAKVIIIEGILVFENKKLREQMDIKIFVDADADVRILRRLVRDVKKRGRDIDSVVEQYLTTVKPMHEKFVEPSKKYANIIIPEGGFNLVALSMIVDKINTILA